MSLIGCENPFLFLDFLSSVNEKTIPDDFWDIFQLWLAANSCCSAAKPISPLELPWWSPPGHSAQWLKSIQLIFLFLFLFAASPLNGHVHLLSGHLLIHQLSLNFWEQEQCFQVFGGGLVAKSTVTLQTPPSLAFSRQEYWSGLPFPFQGIFLTQGSNWHLLHCRQILYQGGVFKYNTL